MYAEVYALSDSIARDQDSCRWHVAAGPARVCFIARLFSCDTLNAVNNELFYANVFFFINFEKNDQPLINSQYRTWIQFVIYPDIYTSERIICLIGK